MLCSGAKGQERGDESSRPEPSRRIGRTFALRSRISAGGCSQIFLTTMPILLEIASYIYAADSAISRGGKTDAHLGAISGAENFGL